MELCDLIENPNCNFECPKEKFNCCKELGCHKHGTWFLANELKSRFTIEEIQKIKELWDNKMGFLRNDGCIIAKVLGRAFMPLVCLYYDCHNVKTIRSDYYVNK